ncbi:hypothetical protein FB451DRAFT_454654 [Mycena latifolia]|nr:hypothetical protein FB451DRAFT_454654 [Mycena latifolia]
MESKPKSLFQTAVRHVFLCGDSSELPRYKKFLEGCSGIINLYIDRSLDDDLLPALSIMHPQKLALIATSPLQFGDPLFLSVTHLDIYVGYLDEMDKWENWSHLSSLPALTHLSLSEELSNAILPRVVAECANLLLVLTLVSLRPEEPTVPDPRVVVTPLAEYRADWIKGAWGGDDMWARADEFLARKRRGEIPSTCFILEAPSGPANLRSSASASESEHSPN